MRVFLVDPSQIAGFLVVSFNTTKHGQDRQTDPHDWAQDAGFLQAVVDGMLMVAQDSSTLGGLKPGVLPGVDFPPEETLTNGRPLHAATMVASGQPLRIPPALGGLRGPGPRSHLWGLLHNYNFG